MKPIKLKIKGLNSFIDEQVIDFEKLTDRGLFGIFGDTGSGKSTILDGITLALYGVVARKSSNFINTNCDNMSVSYKFRISGKETKTYIVDRQFRRDKGTGNPRSSNAKIVELIDDETEVLADGANSVTKMCEEIIGLKIDDFSRTVVLPQGKFSEFLKLEGKARREMLERLFNLQKYGDELSRKLAFEIRKNKDEDNILSGELKGFEDISKKKLDDNKEILKSIKEKLEEAIENQTKIEKNFNDGQELWNLQEELNKYKKEETNLKEQEENINSIKNKVVLGESALKVKPYIDTYEGILKDISNIEKNLIDLNNELEEINKEKNTVEEKLDKLRIKKENEIPLLKIKEEKVTQAIKEKENLDNIIKEIEVLEEKHSQLKEILKDKDIQGEKIDSNIKNINEVIAKNEISMDSLKVDSEYKNKVQQGLLISNKHSDLKKQIDKLKEKILKTKKETNSNYENYKLYTVKVEEKDNVLKTLNIELETINNNCPGNEDELLELKEKFINGKNTWDKYNRLEKEIKEIESKIQKSKTDFASKKEEEEKVKNNLEKLKEKLKRSEEESLAQILREKLKQGDICPVCGSREHSIEKIEINDLTGIDELKNSIDKEEKLLKSIEQYITREETNIVNEESKVKDKRREIQELGEDFKQLSVYQLENNFKIFSEKFKAFNEKKKITEDKIKNIKDEKNTLESKLSGAKASYHENKKQCTDYIDSYKVIEEEMKKVGIDLDAIKTDIGIEDFEEKNKEILLKDKSRTFLEKEIKKHRSEVEDLSSIREKLIKEVSRLKEEIMKEATTIIEKNNNKKEKIASIKEKVGEEKNLEELGKKITKDISEIEENFKITEKQKKDIDEKHKEINDRIVSSKGQLETLTSSKKSAKAKLEDVLNEEKFADLEEAKKNYLDKQSIDSYKNSIENYSKELTKVLGAIENVSNKINGRSLLKEQWEQLKNEKEEIKVKVKELDEERIKKEEEINILKEKLKELGELKKKKEKLEHKLALLSDLEKLFKGKKFVEYVAANQLKYISIEASKILKEITSGNYALEVDENARFIIRDYKNGGVERDVSTLSGGETFLSSLALALALSSQIQLKGTAPLELFFLDEGFGTLDNNLLEVVIEALEKIHHDKLKVGIISHVESLKNRVPVKLLLTPAESGKGGSKVRLERS
ncbi:SbcC/MukB-like Walker B domain-containing protein [Clostridium sp. DL1XJH146]